VQISWDPGKDDSQTVLRNDTCDLAVVLWSTVNDSCMGNTMVMNVSVGRSASISRVIEQNLLIDVSMKKPNTLRDVEPPKDCHHLKNSQREHLTTCNSSGFVFQHFPTKYLKCEEKFVLCGATVHKFSKYLGATSISVRQKSDMKGVPYLCTPHLVHHVCSGRNSQCAVNGHKHERNVMFNLRDLYFKWSHPRWVCIN
jgi:hypothetical protein